MGVTMIFNPQPVVIYLTITLAHPTSGRILQAHRLTREFAPGELPMLECPSIGDKFKLFANSVRIIDREIDGEKYSLVATLEFEQPDKLETQEQADAFILGKVQNYLDLEFEEVVRT